MSHGGWGVTRFKRSNTCHPERKHYSFGLCWPCYRNTPEGKARARSYYLRNIAAYQEASRKCRDSYRREAARYGITSADIFAMLEAQQYLCAICRRPPGKKRLAVDHDHQTGHVRAMLCHRCNLAIGALGDSAETVERAVEYLRHHSLPAKTSAA